MDSNVRLKFRAMNEMDFKNTGNIVKTAITDDNFTTLANSYGFSDDMDYSDIEVSLAKLHTRSVLKLESPTFNYVLARSNAKYLAKVLGISEPMWLPIVHMDRILDKSTKELVSVDEANPDGSYLYGPEIAAYYIENLDIEKAKIDCLYSALGDSFTSTAVLRDFITIDRQPEGLHLCAGYYAHFNVEVLTKNLKRGRKYENLRKEFISRLYGNESSRFTLLMNMNPDKSGLYGMLNYYIVMIPEDMRPKIERSEHKLTKSYTRVLKADTELRSIKVGFANPKDIRAKYLMLDSAVSKLQYKNFGLDQKDSAPDDLAILERVKSKKGQIRQNNLGKRQDYSGRAVVCINPFLPVDVIKVPKSMLPKLLEFHILPYLAANIKKNAANKETYTEQMRIYDKIRLTNLRDPDAQNEMLKIIRSEKLLDRIPCYMGRQPTLHKQSLQGFHLDISDLQAIEVNPLVCPAFNMDFDGDQAHIEVPLGPKAVKEVNDLLLTTQNLFLSKTGECTTEPRQDMLYGLYVCTDGSYKIGANTIQVPFENLEEVRQAVMNHKIRVSDTVKVMEPSYTMIAGDAAFMACFAPGDIYPRGSLPGGGQLTVTQVDKKTITKYINYLLRTDSSGNLVHPLGTGYAPVTTVVGSINRLVELGFKVAKLYSPSMSLIMPHISVPEYDNAISKFHKDMEVADLYYGIGLETSDNYKIEFDNALKVLEESVNKNIYNKLGDDNGYALLAKSGARGSKSNLIQTFTYKGRVKKNSTESFDALLTNSYATQLTPLEHFVAAYGGRQGQIDKSLKTGDTGYAMRQMWHATQGVSITNLDCGATQGLKISKQFITTFVDVSDGKSEDAKVEVASVFKHAIIGRYRVGDASKVISEAEAERWSKDESIDFIEIRSPLTCNKPCCQKCYGIDWSTHKPAVVGLPAGIIAAQSIGEPGTQLTLKQFQKGGVAGKAEVTSAFDKVNKYIHVADLAKASADGKYSGYDPLAWADGEVIETPASDMNRKNVTIAGYKGKRISVPKDVILKKHAVKGQGLSYKHGDYNLSEIVEYSGIEEAQKYLIFKLFYLYKSEVEIALCHFEILVANMTRFMIVDTDRKDLKIGQYSTRAELFAGNVSKTEYVARLLSVQSLLQASNEALDSIIMEDQMVGLSRICLLEAEDSLTKPINRMVMGQTILDGSAMPGFIEARKEKIS